jgi:hypothetical protein
LIYLKNFVILQWGKSFTTSSFRLLQDGNVAKV